jgi:hypothetical protein
MKGLMRPVLSSKKKGMEYIQGARGIGACFLTETEIKIATKLKDLW